MLWIEFFSGSIAEPLRGLFRFFHQPILRSQIHPGGGMQRCHISGFGWGVMSSKQLRRRRFHISYIRRYLAGRDSSGDLLDTIYKFDSFNNPCYQFFSIQPVPVPLGTLRQFEDHRQTGRTAAAALRPTRAQSHSRER